MSNIIDSIQLSGVTYTLQGSGGGGNPTVELTQAEYDALVTAGTVSADTYYIITDATPVDISQYWTSAQTQSAINQATSGKVNTSSVVSSVTSASTDSEIPTAKAVWEAASGGSVTIDSSFDRNSENAISNKVVSRGTIGSYSLVWEGSGENLKNIIQAYDQGGHGISDKNLVYTKINNKPVISIYSNKNNVPYNIEVVETSAITTAVTSSSTDSEIPSAKAVWDAIPTSGGGITSGEVQSMIDESVSGKQDTLISGTNIKTINNQSLLGSGNITIQGGGGGSSTFDENYPVLEKHSLIRSVEFTPLTSFTENSIYVKPYEGYDECAIIIAVDDIGDGYVNLYLTGSTVYSLNGGESAVLDYVNIQRDNGYFKITQIDFSKNVILSNNSNSEFYFAPYIIESGSTEDAIKQAAQKTLDESIKYSNNFVAQIDSFQLDNEDLRLYYSNGNNSQYNQSIDNFLTKDGEIYNNYGLKVKPIVNSGTTTWSTILEVPDGKYYENGYTFPSFIDSTYKKFRVYYNSGVTFDDGEEMQLTYHYIGGDTYTYFYYDGNQDTFVTENQDFTCTKQNYYLEFEYIGNDASLRWNYVILFGRSFDSDSLYRIDVYGKQLLNLQEAYESVSSGGSGGMTEDDELLLSTALTDLNDRKIDASEVKLNYQKKGDYVTTSTLNTRLAEYETALDEQNVEEVTAYALNDLNERFGGLKIVKITESEYTALTTKDENTLYIVVADPT